MEARSALREVGTGTLIILIGFVLGAGLEYVLKAVLARSLGPSRYGLFMQGIAVVQVLAVVGVLGLHKALPRFIAQDRAAEEGAGMTASILTAVLLTLLISSVVAIALRYAPGWAVAAGWIDPALAPVLRSFAIALVPLALFYLGISMLRGIEDTRYKVLVGDIGLPVIEIVLVLVALSMGMGLMGAVWAYVGAVCLAVALTVLAFLRLAKDRLAWPDGLVARELVVFSWPLLLVALITALNRWVDVLMVGGLMDAASAGTYEVALAIGGFLLLFLSSLNYIFMPVATRLSETDPGALASVYRTSTRWIVALSGPLVLGMLLFPDSMIAVLFGQGYTAGALSLSIVSIGFFVSVLVGPAGMLLVAYGRTRWFLAGMLVLLGVDVAGNLLLVPVYGMEGAAMALVVAYVVSSMVLLWSAERTAGARLRPDRVPVVLTALGIVGGVGLVIGAVVPSRPLLDIGAGLVLTLLYGLVLLRLGGIGREDIALVREELDRVRAGGGHGRSKS